MGEPAYPDFLDFGACDSDLEDLTTGDVLLTEFVSTSMASSSCNPPSSASSDNSSPEWSPNTPRTPPCYLSSQGLAEYRNLQHWKTPFALKLCVPKFHYLEPERDVGEETCTGEESPGQPISVFYVRPTIAGVPFQSDRYLALYLSQRNLSCFLTTLARKTGIRRSVIGGVTAVDYCGTIVNVDDDFIGLISSGQAIIAELHISEGALAPGGHPLVLRF